MHNLPCRSDQDELDYTKDLADNDCVIKGSQEIEMHQVKTNPSIGLTIDDVHKAEKMLLGL